LHLVQEIYLQDNMQCLELTTFVLDNLAEDECIPKSMTVMDEATFHTNGWM
jgi:hypothetical protein